VTELIQGLGSCIEPGTDVLRQRQGGRQLSGGHTRKAYASDMNQFRARCARWSSQP
jgi:hypothetical protein